MGTAIHWYAPSMSNVIKFALKTLNHLWWWLSVLIAAFRRGNKPPVLSGGRKIALAWVKPPIAVYWKRFSDRITRAIGGFMQIKKGERNAIHITFKIPLSVSHRICTEVSQERNLWTVEKRHRRNTADIVQAKECGDTGGRGVCRPHTYDYFLLGTL